ncbi:MAG: hypothetical protein JWR14_736 [Caballeronia sp.]|jgi:hypothetical protein|nr:hypothetical protein [Caballeronia sp.]
MERALLGPCWSNALSSLTEMRLIYSADDNDCESNIFSFDIEPNKLFDRILFDPRMDESLQDSYIEAVEKLGCKVDVRRSPLYDPPKGMKFKLG